MIKGQITISREDDGKTIFPTRIQYNGSFKRWETRTLDTPEQNVSFTAFNLFEKVTMKIKSFLNYKFS
jgi:hypothetical protein